MIENSNIGLAFTWDPNKNVLKSFVDGIIYETVFNPVSRSFWSLNYNPVKFVEGMLPNQDSILNLTTLNNAYFKNISFESTEPLIRGKMLKKEF